MDPIMKLLEDDEDESLHSGADVEAFTAALNREVEASASASASTSTSVPAGSSSQPTDHGAGLLPQEHKSLLNHDPGQWQDPVKNEIVNQESQQQEQTHAFRNDHPSRPEMVSQGSNNCPLPTNTPKECDLLKAKQEPGSTSQQGIVAQHQPMQQMKSEQTPIVSQQQSMQQMKNQQTPVTNQTNSATTTAKAPVVTFHMLIPILSRYLDKARDIEVQSIFAKLRKNEVSKEYFLKTVRNIVGDKLLKQAASQYQMQAQRSPQTNPSNYSLSGQVSGQQTAPSGSVTGDEQKGYPGAHTIPMRQAIASTRPPQFRPSSSGQMRSNTGYPPSQTNLHKANEMGNMSDGKGVHMLQTRPPNNSIPVQTMQHHVQRPQTSSPVFGANSIHARPFPRPLGGPAAPFRPQMADSNPKAQLIQGAVTTVSGSVPTRSIVSGNAPVNQALGSSKVSAGMESQSQQLSAPKPLAATSLSQTQSHGIQEEPKIQIQSSVQAPPAAASKTPQRKASSGQKKPLEVLGSSPPPSSKKQKVSGGFHEQSIDQLNDVTAVSGVNLREEEEHLFSAPKEEGRVSEVARKVVQLEEEKLILQKGPLTQKLAGIMSKCNLKVIGTDVERCLSMCVEERLRGFIRSIIRFSKQRVEVEKSRHHFYPLSSDVRSHIMRVNREAREQWEKKQAEDAERIRKQNDGDGNANVDLEKDRIETRGLSKHAKTYKEDDDKMRTTAANVAARVAAGGDDMLSKWQLLAERNKQRSEGGDGSSGSVPGNMLQHRPSLKSGKDLREEHEVEKRGYSTMLGSGTTIYIEANKP
ncbi:transcription initiation factor TFIID subunit 4b isoform X3 [Zea mays]|uniref:transcription initiation factor TFIID subunit 4b isoform X3 n=1 Tax=Zea mays TaxID=4577 RepID=UPI0009AAA4EB|nr:transcription initiation factor TFIID subunit 4b isoform X3 [Zea mays]|eukprot:XP_020401999.1 transcription initiation factor TFIID subunit 4b isoform X3 [Zea mays]